MAISLANATAIHLADQLDVLINTGAGDGYMRIYDDSGTPTVPVQADDGLGGAVQLAQLDFDATAFGNAADANPGATITLAGVPIDDLDIDATGTATFFRIFDADDNVVLQGTVGENPPGTADAIVDDEDFVAGATARIVSLTITMPES